MALRPAREPEVSLEDLFLLGEAALPADETVRASLLSSSDRETNRPVRLACLKDRWVATSVESVPYYLPDADGIVTRSAKGFSDASVLPIGATESLGKRLFIAGCDPAIGLLALMYDTSETGRVLA